MNMIKKQHTITIKEQRNWIFSVKSKTELGDRERTACSPGISSTKRTVLNEALRVQDLDPVSIGVFDEGQPFHFACNRSNQVTKVPFQWFKQEFVQI